MFEEKEIEKKMVENNFKIHKTNRMICLIFYCTNFITIFFYQLQYMKTCYQYISFIVIFQVIKEFII